MKPDIIVKIGGVIHEMMCPFQLTSGDTRYRIFKMYDTIHYTILGGPFSVGKTNTLYSELGMVLDMGVHSAIFPDTPLKSEDFL